MRRLIAAVAAGLLLAGCSGAPAAPKEPPAQVVATSEAPAPSPTVTVATEKQVASIIAGIEPDMREVIDGAFDCRFLNVQEERTALEEAQLTGCYAAEVTAALTAGRTIQELVALTPPPSMETLVEDTIKALQSIVAADLEGECGEPFGEISDSGECSFAFGKAVQAYAELETQLDKWGPYL